MNTKTLITVIVLTFIFIGGFLYIRNPSIQSSPSTVAKMRIASYYWPGQYWVNVADKKGWFTEAGLDVEIIDTTQDYAGSLNDVASGELDTQNFWLFDLLQMRGQGSELVMVLNADTSLGAEALVADASIKTVNDLRGKRIGVEKGLATEYLLYTVLRQNNLTLSDIVMVNDSSEQLPFRFKNNELDALVVWEPYIAEALEKPGSTRLWDTSQSPGIISAGYVFRKEYIEANRENVEKFVRVWHKTTQYMAQNPDESFAIVADYNNDTPENVRQYTAINRVQDLEDNLRAFSRSGGFSSLYGQMQLINSYLGTQEMSIDEQQLSDALDSSFIDSIDLSNE